MVAKETGFCATIVSMETFGEWILEEIKKRGWSQNELAKRSGLAHGSISNIINGNKGFTNESVAAIAHALRISPEVVFRKAGLLPPAPDIQTEEQQFLYLLHLMDESSRDELFEFMKFKLEHKAANKATSRGKKPARSALNNQ